MLGLFALVRSQAKTARLLALSMILAAGWAFATGQELLASGLET